MTTTLLAAPSPVAPRPETSHACRALLSLPAKAHCVPAARRFASEILIRWGVPDGAREDAELIVSELATNAALHGRCDLTVGLILDAGILHVMVSDTGGDAAPRAARGGSPDEQGRGLDIVGVLAQRMRTHLDTAGRRVHVRLSATALDPE
jgi:anti-sigma regulatory factor (Ser/Thr protein kinase)